MEKNIKQENLDNLLKKKVRSDCKYNREFSIIDTEEKAYFLGLLYADGSISQIKEGLKSKDYLIKLSLHIQEEYLIDKLHKIFPFFLKGTFDYSKYYKGNSKQVNIRYCSPFLFKDLSDNGLLPRKSYENKELLHIPNIDKSLIHHFIRGYFDGDGSIFKIKRRKNLRRVEICSVSKKFLEEINIILKENNCSSKTLREKKQGRIQSLYVLELINTDSIINFRDFIYKDATIFMERKWEKFKDFKRVDKTIRDISCPHCNSNRLQDKGLRQMKTRTMQRYTCLNKECKKCFSIPIALLKSDELLENPEMDNQQPS